MADNRELNPGQRHYQDLSNRRHGALAVMDNDDNTSQADYSNYNNYSSPTDYSGPEGQFGQQYKNNTQFTGDNTSGSKYNDYPTSDYNKSSRDYLNQGEQASLSYSSNRNIDLSRQENDASHQTSGFDSSNISKQKSSRVGNFKKRLIFGGLIATLSGGIIGAAMFVISGPMEIIQFAEYIKDFHTNITTAQSAARSFSASRSIARMMDSGSISKAVRNSRVGAMGRYMSDKMTQRLKNNGLELKSNWAGAAEGMDIDVNKMLGKDTLDPGDIDKVIKELELPDGKYSVNGSILSIDGDIGYSNVRRILNNVGDVGKWDIVGYLRTRSTMKSLGYVSVWHPLQKAKNKAYQTATDLLKDFVDNINRTDDTPSRARDGAEDEANDRNQAIDDGDIDGEKVDVDASGETASDAIREIQASDDNVGRGVRKNISNTDGINLKIAGSALGLASAIVGALCIIKGIVETMGPQKQANTVNPGMGYVSTYLGFGSEVQNGSKEGDIDADTLGKVKKAFFYDEVPILDENGNDTGQKEPSSVYSDRVCEDIGITNCASTDNDPLTEIVDLVYQVGSAGLPSIVRDIFNMVNAVNQSVGGPVIDFVCSAMDVIGTVTGSVGDFIQDMIMNFISTTDMAINAMTAFMNLINGGGLPDEPTPAQFSIIVSSAAGWMVDEVGRTTNGASLLNKVQSAELQLENRRYLAWKNSQKPLLARLFDPSDYNSSISQIAKIAKINSSDRSLSTQISNVFKVFASAPSIIATAGNQLVGGSAYAASYQDGRPVYAWSVEDMNEFTSASTSNSQYDMVKNTDYVIGLLEDEGTPNSNEYDDLRLMQSSKPLHAYAYTCLGVTIAGSPDYTVSINDNSDGEWNYPDNLANPFCSGDQRPNGYKELGLYVMDYNNTVAGACYEGGEDDGEANSACNEMGVGTAGPSGSIALGSNDPAAYQQSFATYMKNAKNNAVEGLTVCFNGCTTVPAWFVSQYTTLTYGQGNGWQVAQNLATKNGLEVTHTLDANCKLPAVFSSSSPAMGSVSSCSAGAAPNGLCGHTGLVVSMDDDGTIQILESGSSQCGTENLSWIQTRTRAEWEGNTDFVCLGDYLK